MGMLAVRTVTHRPGHRDQTCNLGDDQFPSTSNGDGGVIVVPVASATPGLRRCVHVQGRLHRTRPVPDDVDGSMAGVQTFVQLDVYWSENRAIDDQTDGPLFHTETPPAMLTIVTNEAPTAVSDFYVASENTPLVVSAADGVLDNDTDPDNDTLTAVCPAPRPTARSRSVRTGRSPIRRSLCLQLRQDSFNYADDGTVRRSGPRINVVASNNPSRRER